MNRITVFGNGYIGSQIAKHLECDVVDTKIKSYKDMEKAFDGKKPDVIINAIGVTGTPNVDACEKDVDGTLLANSFVPIILAEYCHRNGIKFVHISSGCIFHHNYTKDEPIKDDDYPDYFDLFYSRTKIYSEMAIRQMCKENGWLILRIRIPFDGSKSERNLLSKLLSFKTVIEIKNSVTYIPDFLKALKWLIDGGENGIYNIVNDPIYYSEILKCYREETDREFNLMPKSELSMPRTNLIMSNEKIHDSGFDMLSSEDVIKKSVDEYIGEEK